MVSRREFLQKGLIGMGALAVPVFPKSRLIQTTDWPQGQKLGRNCTGGWITLRSKPSTEGQDLGRLYEDDVFVWIREVVGDFTSISRRWVETPNGYVYAPNVQPVLNIPNNPLKELPRKGDIQGMWVEVSVPYVDFVMDNPPPRSPWLKEAVHPRLYYSQVMWVDAITTDAQGKVIYRLIEHHGTYGDIFWAPAEAFKQITEEDLAPINPDVENKRIVVNLSYQTLSCYEGNSEVYFCRISSGSKFDASGNVVEKWSTPPGAHNPHRKLISIHMAGGSSGAGWDTPGIGWTFLFDPDGAAIHSTFWHNDFGVARSHGCVNALPEDAKWIFRWTQPQVPYYPGDIAISGPGATIVDVTQA